jgi:hypothetical protein
VFYINKNGEQTENSKHENITTGPQYPSVKLDVSYYQKEASDIMEESIEEKKRVTIKES